MATWESNPNDQETKCCASGHREGTYVPPATQIAVMSLSAAASLFNCWARSKASWSEL